MMCSTSLPLSHVLCYSTFSVFLMATTGLKNCYTFFLSEESVFCVVTSPQSTLNLPLLHAIVAPNPFPPIQFIIWSPLKQFSGVDCGCSRNIFFSSPSSPSTISFITSMISFASILPHIFQPGGFTCNFFCASMHLSWRSGLHRPGLSIYPLWYQACCKFFLLSPHPPHHNLLLPKVSHPHRNQVWRVLWENLCC